MHIVDLHIARYVYVTGIEQRRHSALQEVVCHEVTCPPK